MKNNEFDFTNSIEIIKDTDVYKNDLKKLENDLEYQEIMRDLKKHQDHLNSIRSVDKVIKKILSRN